MVKNTNGAENGAENGANGSGSAENGASEQVNVREIQLDELLDGYDIVETTETSVLVTERGYGPASEPLSGLRALAEASEYEVKGDPTKEIGGSSETLYRRAVSQDYNPELSGRRAIDKYREMRNDSVVRSTLKLHKTPVLAARWFVQPASQLPEDQAKAQFVWDNLTKWMSMSFPQFITEAMLMCDYGVYSFEKVFQFKNWYNPLTEAFEEKLAWRKFAPRPPYEIEEFVYDKTGGPEAVTVSTETEPKDIGINKMLVFTFDKEGGDLWGFSLLRSAYKHWFYKEQLYKIDAIQKERHGIGIPVIVLPPNFSATDKRLAEKIGESLRTNEKAHVVLPPGWEVYFLKLEGQRVDALESAQHHAEKLYENVLANFMVTRGDTGAITALEAVHTKVARFTAEIIRDVINHYAIPQLMMYNWPEEEMPHGYPELKVRRLGDERDWRTISFAIRNFIGAQAMMVDDPLRHWIRDEMDLPIEDPETAFYVGESDYNEEGRGEKPAVGEAPDDDDDLGTPNVGTPRQKATPPVGTPNANAGTDRSGG